MPCGLEELQDVPPKAMILFLVYMHIYIYIYNLFLAVLSHYYCARAFSSYVTRVYSLVVVSGLLIVVTSLAMEHGLF